MITSYISLQVEFINHFVYKLIDLDNKYHQLDQANSEKRKTNIKKPLETIKNYMNN